MLFSLAVVACSSPARRFDLYAAEQGLVRSSVEGEGFDHVVYRRSGSVDGTTLHVYLDGDGTPWIRGRIVADDPTPRLPLTLDLMVQDPAPSLYLSRPCYGIEERPTACSPYLWTHGRYSAEIVASMHSALSRIVENEGIDSVVLIGYSGGGTLAMLLAPRVRQVRAVITVAGNLDIDAWTTFHEYSPLSGSLNPVAEAPLPADVVQVHYVGERDKNVPPRLVAAVARREVAASVRIVPEFDHECCWRRDWVRLLASLEGKI